MNLNSYYSNSEKYFDCNEYVVNNKCIDYDDYNYNRINRSQETSLLKDYDDYLTYTSRSNKFNINKIHYSEVCYFKKEKDGINNVCSHHLFIEYNNETKSIVLNGLEVYQLFKEHKIYDNSIDQHLIDQYENMLKKAKEEEKYRQTFRFRLQIMLNKFLKKFCCYVPKYIRLEEIEMD
jgi:hypothetical protein